MLEAAQKRLIAATKKGDPWELGYAHLEVSYALLQRSTEWLEYKEDAKNALSQADQAIESFNSIPFPGGIASAHLARASIYTQLADGEGDQLKKIGGVDRALTSCLAAQDALNTEGVHHGQRFDIYSSVSVLLILLRGMIMDEEFQEQFDQLITANSTLLGKVVAEDIKLRDEGGSMLFTAQMLGALAEIEEDEEEKKDIIRTQSMVALQAGQWLETSSDSGLINQALELSQDAWAKIEPGGTPSPKLKKDHHSCPQCGSDNKPGAKYCSECGTSLKEAN